MDYNDINREVQYHTTHVNTIESDDARTGFLLWPHDVECRYGRWHLLSTRNQPGDK